MTDNKDKSSVEKDAQGQFAKSQGDRDNNGLADAKPRSITGKEDATTGKPGDKNRNGDWDSNFDEREQTNNRG